MILQALGRRPNLQGLGLEAAGVTVIDGRLTVSPDMRTSQPHIFAVGDVNDLTPIVHLAIQQGETAACNATHPNEPARMIDHRLDAEAVFTEPQVGVAGLSERQCREQGHPIFDGLLSVRRSWESDVHGGCAWIHQVLVSLG